MSAKVKHDGHSYYCARCGKAGFLTEMAARGHLSACGGRAPVVAEISSLAEKFQHAAAIGAPGAPPPPPAAFGGAGGGGGAQPTVVSFVEYLRVRNEAEQLRVQLAQVQEERNRAVQLASNHAMHLGGPSGVLSVFERPEVKLLIGLLLIYAVTQALKGDDAKKVGGKVLGQAGSRMLERIFA